MNIFKNIYLHIKYNRIIQKVYKDENLINGLSELLNVNVRKDWFGRLYMVLNPNLIKMTDQIYEVTDKGLNNSAFVEKWIMERFIVLEKFIKANNLFDLLTYSLKQIDEQGNYLLILEPITFKDYFKSLKFLSISLPIAIIICIISMIIF